MVSKNKFNYFRPISAPPIHRITPQITNELEREIVYTSFFRYRSRVDVRLPLPNFHFEGQGSFYSKGGVSERIDEDFPNSETSDFTGTSRTTTPTPGEPVKINETNKLSTDLVLFAKRINPFYDDKTIPVDLAKDQEGSRFIQKRMEIATESEKIWYFNVIRPHLFALSTDLFGNYIVQKILATNNTDIIKNDDDKKNGNVNDFLPTKNINNFSLNGANFNLNGGRFGLNGDVRLMIYNDLKKDLINLSYDVYGCRVVQKIIDYNEFEPKVWKNHLVDLIKDQNGNHVVQKIIEKNSDSKWIEVIGAEFVECAIEMAKHKYGCRALQRLFEIYYKNQNTNKCGVGCAEDDIASLIDNIKIADSNIKKIIDQVLESAESLILDQFGNYVIQHILEFGTPKNRNVIMKILIPNMFQFSIHKFASNVMEKCIKVVSEINTGDDSMQPLMNYRKELISQSLSLRGNKPCLALMCMNQYGNYVVQRIIDNIADNSLLECLRGFVGELRRSVYAKQVVGKLFIAE